MEEDLGQLEVAVDREVDEQEGEEEVHNEL